MIIPGIIDELHDDLEILYAQYDIRYNKIQEYVKSLGLEPELGILDYPKGPRYCISDFICKTNIMRISGDIIEKQLQLINAVEAYLKLECFESYVEDNLETVFKKAREDDDCRYQVLNFIEKFIFG